VVIAKVTDDPFIALLEEGCSAGGDYYTMTPDVGSGGRS
jgi:hypothetical protein